jgi:hypothetical protein
MKNMVKVKPAKMTGGAGGGLGRLEKTAVAPAKGKNAKDLKK